MKNKPTLYIKRGCPWCDAALDFFNARGVALELRDVLRDAGAWARLQAVSGQTRCPTFEWDGFVVADFSVEEFLAKLKDVPQVCRELGLD